MTKRKSFNITDLNNKQIIDLQETVKENGNNIQQASIINLAIELFFRNKTPSELVNIMMQERLL